MYTVEIETCKSQAFRYSMVQVFCFHPTNQPFLTPFVVGFNFASVKFILCDSAKKKNKEKKMHVSR